MLPHTRQEASRGQRPDLLCVTSTQQVVSTDTVRTLLDIAAKIWYILQPPPSSTHTHLFYTLYLLSYILSVWYYIMQHKINKKKLKTLIKSFHLLFVQWLVCAIVFFLLLPHLPAKLQSRHFICEQLPTHCTVSVEWALLSFVCALTLTNSLARRTTHAHTHTHRFSTLFCLVVGRRAPAHLFFQRIGTCLHCFARSCSLYYCLRFSSFLSDRFSPVHQLSLFPISNLQISKLSITPPSTRLDTHWVKLCAASSLSGRGVCVDSFAWREGERKRERVCSYPLTLLTYTHWGLTHSLSAAEAVWWYIAHSLTLSHHLLFSCLLFSPFWNIVTLSLSLSQLSFCNSLLRFDTAAAVGEVRVQALPLSLSLTVTPQLERLVCFATLSLSLSLLPCVFMILSVSVCCFRSTHNTLNLYPTQRRRLTPSFSSFATLFKSLTTQKKRETVCVCVINTHTPYYPGPILQQVKSTHLTTWRQVISVQYIRKEFQREALILFSRLDSFLPTYRLNYRTYRVSSLAT